MIPDRFAARVLMAAGVVDCDDNVQAAIVGAVVRTMIRTRQMRPWAVLRELAGWDMTQVGGIDVSAIRDADLRLPLERFGDAYRHVAMP